MRKLGRGAEASVDGIEARLQQVERARRRLSGQRAARRPGRRLQAPERRLELLALRSDRAPLLAIRRRDPRQQVDKTGQPVAPFFRKVGAAEERRAIGREEHRERPAARPAREQRVRGLVDLVQVRAFLAVDFHVHEQRVHRRGDVGVLEGFVRHHVAPVAGRVAYREQDRLLLAARECKRLLPPRVPIHGVVRVLQQVGAGLAGEPVGHVVSPRLRTPHARNRPRAATAASTGTAAAASPRSTTACGWG